MSECDRSQRRAKCVEGFIVGNWITLSTKITADWNVADAMDEVRLSNSVLVHVSMASQVQTQLRKTNCMADSLQGLQ
jgi:hypothetical protein